MGSLGSSLSVQTHIDAVDEVGLIVAILMSICCRKHKQVVIPCIGRFGIAFVSLGLQLQFSHISKKH